MRVHAVLAIALASLTLACGDDGPAVPFGLDPIAPSTAPPSSVVSSPGAIEWPAGAEVRVDDTPLQIDDVSIRATLATDRDGDGDRDVVFVANTTDGAISLGTATRTTDGLTFAAPLSIASLCAPASIGGARIVPLSNDLIAVRIERVCSGAPEQRVIVVRLSPTPRVLTTLVLAPMTGETMSVRGEDRDDDGHEDLVVHLSLHDVGGESADVDLAWLDRAAGLSRDTAEPEATVSARANEARTALRRHPERALAATRTALLVHDALCGSAARLAIDDDLGLSCPASSGLGRALAMAAAAEARQGHLAETLIALDALSRSDASVRDVDRTSVQDALAAMAGVLRPVAYESVEARVVSGDGPRLSTLAFVDDDHVLIRGNGARVVMLSTGTSTPSVDRDTTIADASRAHCIDAIERACAGVSLILRPIFGPLDSPSRVSTIALVEARPAPAGALCGGPSSESDEADRLPMALRGDTRGWRALGWAPQGALVARGATLVVVPLDVAGQSVGAPTTLVDDEPAPAPIAPGHATADASAWAFVNRVGLELYRRGSSPQLVMPTPFTHADGSAVDVAISASARRLAWIEAGHLRWVDLDAPPPTPAPTTVP